MSSKSLIQTYNYIYIYIYIHFNPEYTILDRNENSWKNTKKVGTLIGDTEDVQRRNQLSTAALAKLQNVWVRGDKLKKKTKLKLYRALVKSVLTYKLKKRNWMLFTENS